MTHHAFFQPPLPVNEAVRSYAPGSLERKDLQSSLAELSASTCEIRVRVGEKPSSSTVFLPVTSPQRKNLVLARCQQANEDDIAGCLSGKRLVAEEWRRSSWTDRAGVFLKAAELISTKYRCRINAATMLGQGKTVQQAEIDAACELADFLRYNVHFLAEIYADQPVSSAGMWNRSEVRPLEGFVYAVTPFNFTAIAVNLPTAPALMGCRVLWKPAPTSTLAASIAMDILTEAGLPPGVIDFMPGDPVKISNRVLAHPDLSGIHFTGSTPVFNLLWKSVAENLDLYRSYPRVVGETGGKDFVFAHSSAEPAGLVTALVRGAFEYQGQKCSAASRAYIPKSIWPEVKDLLVATTSSISIGDPADLNHFMGAVIDANAFAKIKSYIDFAKSDAKATILVGGECDDSVGYFIKPTVVQVDDPHHKLMIDEIFGPVLSIFVYDDHRYEEAISLCRDSTRYALTGAVFARDRRVIADLSSRFMDAAGNFYINDKPTGAVVGQQPFGGGRSSGTNDKAGSKLNLLRWCSHRTIKETFLTPTDYRYPHMEN